MKKSATSKACLFSIGSNVEALIGLAKYSPDYKDAIMDLIVAEKNILPLLNQSDRFRENHALKLCAAYPSNAYNILSQIIPDNENVEVTFGLSREAILAYKLLRKISTENCYLNYHSFLSTFPIQAQEIFTTLCHNSAFFCSFAGFYQTLKKLLKELPEYRAQLIEILLRQPEEFWHTQYDETWLFSAVAEECPEQKRDALFNTYFSIDGLYKEYYHFKGTDIQIAKLLNLALQQDEHGRNTFGLNILRMLIKLFPEHKQAFFNLLCTHPQALALLLADTPFKFLEIIELAPESKDALLTAIRELPAFPGVFGLFTHGIIDTNSSDHTWSHPDMIMLISEKFSESSQDFLQSLLTNQTLLAKVLSNPYIGPDSAFKLALRFTQYQSNIISAFSETRKETPTPNVTGTLIESAPEEIRPFLKLMREIEPGSDCGNMAIVSVMLQAPALFQAATAYLNEHADDATDNGYQGLFPEELWPWLNILRHHRYVRDRHNLINNICQLFPEQKTQLIRFFLTNDDFKSVVFSNTDNVIAAAKLAPELQRELLLSIKEFGDYRKTRMENLFDAFPDFKDLIMELIFNNEENLKEFFSVGPAHVYQFAHDYPQYQTTLASALIKFPQVFNKVLFDGKFIYELFLLFPNRKLLVNTLCLGAPRSNLENVPLENTLEAIRLLPEYVRYFINYLFMIPGYPQVYCRHDYNFSATAKLPGHQVQIISLLCGIPSLVEFLTHNTENNESSDDCPPECRELIFWSYYLYKGIVDLRVDTVKQTKQYILQQFNSGTIGPAQIRCFVKLVEQIMKSLPAESNFHEPLKRLHKELLKRAIPQLSMFCVNVINNDKTIITDDAPEDIKEYFIQ